jgi:hypothetical protein
MPVLLSGIEVEHLFEFGPNRVTSTDMTNCRYQNSKRFACLKNVSVRLPEQREWLNPNQRGDPLNGP